MRKYLIIVLAVVMSALSLVFTTGCATKGLAYELDKDETSYVLLGFEETVEKFPDKIVIPEKYNGKPVSRIGAAAFRGITEVVSVEIPESIVEIGASAFKGCTNLEEINIPSTVTGIGNSAFEGCKKITSITLPEGLETIADSLLYGCEGITEITIPSSVTKVGAKAFGKTSITKIALPDSVTSLVKNTFKDADKLEEFSLGNGVEIIDEYVFDGCKALKKVTLGTGLRAIHNNAFNDCKALESVTIPQGVRAIYGSAFNGCTSLNYMKFEGAEGTMTQCNNPACGVTICPASNEYGFNTHYHSNYWLNSEQGGSAFMHMHWIFSHDIGDPEQAYKYFVADEQTGESEARTMHNHALGGQGDYWSYSGGKYFFKEEAYYSYGGSPVNVDQDIRGWEWLDSSILYWYNGAKGEY